MEFGEKQGTNATTSKKQALGKSCSWSDGRIVKSLFLLIYLCSTLSNLVFPHTHLNSYVTGEVDEFLVPKLHKTINAIEALLQGKTTGLEQMLPETWPHATYDVYFNGLCRVNDDSSTVCYQGTNIEDLIAGDIGLQIAQYNHMENPNAFRREFISTFHEIKQELIYAVESRRFYSSETEICPAERPS
ncbi:uncharacterized protein CXQ87_002559 [Candidozyma duobushaemuli]|uniref:Uncharacterized protein n=1 Tax=Candidozyma duobushaemuli TaxID=1231522 RepID=A0A2V1A9R5_9ASCO|nr:uncharacterized protein CXQ87_002559 [[Candida] duobushaemulonis]PVH14425.1 hypothetical protein CXQ87_002559 [[Candida] duobushaemulonis]